MKRKIFSLVLAICMLIPACVMLSACKEDKEHTHSFNENHVCVGCDIIEEGYTVKRSNKKTAVAYKTFEEAATALTDGDTLKLYDDVTLESTKKVEGNDEVEGSDVTEVKNEIFDDYGYVVLGNSDDQANGTIQSYTIDLGGHTLTSALGGFDCYANTTLKNGKLVAQARHGCYVEQGAKLVVEKNMEIECTSNTPQKRTGIVIVNGAKLDIAGKVVARHNSAISGNGSPDKGNIEITVREGAEITSDTDVAIYMPATTTLNVEGGTITGTTALYIKSGTTTITGGTFNATLETKVPYVHNGNGCDATGDTIIIEACGYPGGNPIVKISGGTFNKVAEGAYAVAYYTYEGNEASIDITVEGLALNN